MLGRSRGFTEVGSLVMSFGQKWPENQGVLERCSTRRTADCCCELGGWPNSDISLSVPTPLTCSSMRFKSKGMCEEVLFGSSFST